MWHWGNTCIEDSPCTKYDQLLSQLAAIRATAAQLRNEFTQAEAEHRDLVHQLHQELPRATNEAAGLDEIRCAARMSAIDISEDLTLIYKYRTI